MPNKHISAHQCQICAYLLIAAFFRPEAHVWDLHVLTVDIYVDVDPQPPLAPF